jgi:hypothetical protein
MTERIRGISRQDDESLYQPKIHSERIRDLYPIVEETKIPMTILIDFAIQSFVKKYTEAKERRERGLETIEPKIYG